MVGGTLTILGETLTAASTSATAGFNLSPGVAPTSPNNGDLWTTSASIYARINGVTYNLLGACAVCAVTNATNTFTAYQIISLNTATLQAAQTGTLLQVGNANGVISRIEADAFAAVAHFTGLRADGTAASPTTLQSGDQIVGFNAFGYDGSAFVGPQAGLRCYANQNWSHGSALGTYCDIAATANGSTTLTEVAYFGFVSGTTTQAVGIGTNAPTAPLTITTQTAALPTPTSPAFIHLVGGNVGGGAATSGSVLQANTYSSVFNIFSYRADGSLGSESAVNSGDVLFNFVGGGYNGSGYATGAQLRFSAVGNWSGSNEGSVVAFLTKAQNSTSLTTAMSIYAGVVIGSGSTDPGAGNATVSGTLNVGIGSTDYLEFSGGSAGASINTNGGNITLGPGGTTVATLTSGGGFQVGSPTGGDKGAGAINVQSCYVNNVACAVGGTTINTAAQHDIAYYSGTSAISGVAISGLVLASSSANPAAYGGTSCTNQVLDALNASGSGTCVSITNAYLTAGTFSNITGVGTLGAGTASTGFTIAFGSVTMTGQVPLANGGTAANLTASNGGIVYSTASAFAVLAGTATANQCLLSGSNAAPSWGSCSGSTGVASLGNAASDTSLTIAGTGSGPWTGTVTIKLNLGNAQTWTAAQTYNANDLICCGGSTTAGVALVSSAGVITSAAVATTAQIWAATSGDILDAGNVFNGAGAQQALTGTTSVTPNFSNGFNFTFTATSADNFTLQNPSNIKAGQTGSIQFTQPASGTVVTIAFGSDWQFAGGVTPALTATLGAVDVLFYYCPTTSVCIASMANNVKT